MEPQQPVNPPPATPESPTPLTNTKNKIPKWAIILIVVVGVLIILGFLLPLILTGIGVTLLKKQGFEYSSNETQNSVLPQIPVSMPADFPQDVPIYPDAKLIQTLKLGNDNEGSSLSLTFSLDQNKLADAKNFYQTKMAENGWETVVAQNIGDQDALILSKDGGQREVIIQLGTQDGEGRLGVQANKKGAPN